MPKFATNPFAQRYTAQQDSWSRMPRSPLRLYMQTLPGLCPDLATWSASAVRGLTMADVDITQGLCADLARSAFSPFEDGWGFLIQAAEVGCFCDVLQTKTHKNVQINIQRPWNQIFSKVMPLTSIALAWPWMVNIAAKIFVFGLRPGVDEVHMHIFNKFLEWKYPALVLEPRERGCIGVSSRDRRCAYPVTEVNWAMRWLC